MELTITVDQDRPKQEIIKLKNFIDAQTLDGVDSMEIAEKLTQANQMGIGDFTNSLVAIIHAAEKPLVELIVCLQKFVDTFRTSITLKNEGGAELTISSGKKVDQETMERLVKEFLKKK